MIHRRWILLAMLAISAACSSDPVAETTAPPEQLSTSPSTEGLGPVPAGFDFARVRLMEPSELPEGVPVPVPAGGEVNETLSVSEGKSLFVDYDPRFFATAVAFYQTWIGMEALDASPKRALINDAVGWDISIDGQPVEVLVQISDDGSETQLSVLWP